MRRKRTTIVGVGVTELGRLPHTPQELAIKAARLALRDAGLQPSDLRQVFVSNVLGGVLCDQASIRGQVWLRGLGLADTPIFNIESACAGGAVAIHLASQAVESGVAPVLVVGVEKMHSHSRESTLRGIEQCLPADERAEHRAAIGGAASLFMALNAVWAKRQLDERGGQLEDFAAAAVKARKHASLNPVAQHRTLVSIEGGITRSCV